MNRIEIEIGRKTDEEGWSNITKRRESYKEYGRGLYTSFIVDDSITLGELFSQAEQYAREVCLNYGDEFVDFTIYSIQQNCTRLEDESSLEEDSIEYDEVLV